MENQVTAPEPEVVIKPEVEAQFIINLSCLNVGPQSVVVIQCPGKLNKDLAQNIINMVWSVLPRQKMLIFDEGMTLGVINDCRDISQDPGQVAEDNS